MLKGQYFQMRFPTKLTNGSRVSEAPDPTNKAAEQRGRVAGAVEWFTPMTHIYQMFGRRGKSAALVKSSGMVIKTTWFRIKALPRIGVLLSHFCPVP